MTRSITIVNTSNWDGEDYEVRFETVVGGVETVRILRPGERCSFNPAHQKMTFVEKDRLPDNSRSFNLHGVGPAKQVFPFVISGVGSLGEEEV